VIGTLQGPSTYAQVGKSPNVQYDMRGFGWLGSANLTSNTCVFTKARGHHKGGRSADQDRVIGGSGGSTEFARRTC
jgi:hypothetical protein